MSGDVSMHSDDDAPLATKPSTPRGAQNGYARQNGNGRVVSDSPMSDDDDMPLVSGCANVANHGRELIALWDLVPSHADEVRANDPRCASVEAQEGHCIRLLQ